MKIGKTFVATVMMMAAVVASGCSNGSDETCEDYNRKICEKIDTCYSIDENFSQCINQLESANLTDEQCKMNWDFIKDVPCDQLSVN